MKKVGDFIVKPYPSALTLTRPYLVGNGAFGTVFKCSLIFGVIPHTKQDHVKNLKAFFRAFSDQTPQNNKLWCLSCLSNRDLHCKMALIEDS